MKFSSKFFLFISALLGVCFSISLGFYFYEKETQSIQQQFENNVDDKILVLEGEFRRNLEVLYSIKSIFENYNQVSSSEFKTTALSLLQRHPDVQSLVWIETVTDAMRVDYEREKSLDAASFTIWERNNKREMIPANPRDIYYPILFVENRSYSGNVLGFDMGSDNTRLQGLLKSRDLGEPSSTAKITLINSTKSGFLTYLPVFHGIDSSIEKRRAHLRGFVAAIFDIEEIFNSAIHRTTVDGINFNLMDLTDGRDTVMYSSDIKEHKKTYQAPFSYQKSGKSIAGRLWSIDATPSSMYMQQRRGDFPVAISFFGVISVLLASGVIYILIGQKKLINQTVLEKTKDLNQTKKQLEILTLTDSLTDIANRRSFDERLKFEWKRALRREVTLSIILIDIDYFKLFNDKYGHIAGDRSLKEVALMLQKSFPRSTDFVARYGGEEFVVLLSDTTDIFKMADRCRKNIEALRIEHESSTVSPYITISLGVRTLIPSRHCAIVDFVSSADRALYAAKKAGRNQVIILND
jgi:diguanylate cyclase (GGDEF)-like protein